MNRLGERGPRSTTTPSQRLLARWGRAFRGENGVAVWGLQCRFEHADQISLSRAALAGRRAA